MALIVTGTLGGLTDLGTITLHLATMWPRPVIVIEADPDGGRLAVRHNWEARPGLSELAAYIRTPATSTIHLPALRRNYRPDIDVIVAPPSAEHVIAALRVIAPHASHINDLVTEDSAHQDVIIDVGRIRPDTPASDIIRAADLRLLITRTDLDDVVALVNRQELLVDLGEWRILTAGGRYTVDELSRNTTWPVIGDLLPGDRRSSAATRQAIAQLAHGVTRPLISTDFLAQVVS